MKKILLAWSAYSIITSPPIFLQASSTSAQYPENLALSVTKSEYRNDAPAHVTTYLNTLAGDISSSSYLRLPHLLEHLCTCALRNTMTHEQYECFLNLIRTIPSEELWAVAQRPAGEQVKKFLTRIQKK